MKYTLKRWWWTALGSLILTGAGPVAAQGNDAIVPDAQGKDAIVLEAQQAFVKRDRDKLEVLRASVAGEGHPLAAWVDYWDLNSRLEVVTQEDLEAFYARWPGSYVEDRLRNDWLLELGKRRDWPNFRTDFPRFRMNDDREVTCYALLTEHLEGRDVRDIARQTWFAQLDSDDGCHLLASTLLDDGRLTLHDVWQKLRLSIEFRRPRAAELAASLISPAVAGTVRQLVDKPARYLTRTASKRDRTHAELVALALGRMAANDPGAVARQLETRWERQLPKDLAAWAWTVTAKHSALDLLPEAHARYVRALALTTRTKRAIPWTDSTQAWRVRAALRAVDAADRWKHVRAAIAAMSDDERREPTWIYWDARALLALAERARPAQADRLREQAGRQLAAIANPLTFYGQLAAEELKMELRLPAAPAAPEAAVRDAVRAHPGLTRALHLIGLGLRGEGVREWNFSLRGMSERELLAAAQWACEHEVWDRCINTSDRTRGEIDLAQRYPLPFREQLEVQAREAGLETAYVYGLVRQESRFILDARSHAGASGLMQVMPATARWVARKIGLDYRRDMITDRDMNLRLGTAYLRLVLDDFGGSQAMAAAAYNAGPNRPRRWREGPLLETAIWAETIPFTETRNYVKNVLANAAVYAARLGGQETVTLRSRLGSGVGPRAPDAPAPDSELP